MNQERLFQTFENVHQQRLLRMWTKQQTTELLILLTVHLPTCILIQAPPPCHGLLRLFQFLNGSLLCRQEVAILGLLQIEP